jgi:tRNA threonylcarbamoyladenosine biosynthesis protein TsaE
MVATIPSRTLEYSSLSELGKIAAEIIAFADDVKVWSFEGEMGAGKTTLIREIGRQLKVKDNVTSPTFSLVNEYETEAGEIIYHFDFYRIKNQKEAMDIGVEEYFYSGNRCFLEWPSRIPDLLPEELLEIKISLKDNSRIINLFKNRPLS